MEQNPVRPCPTPPDRYQTLLHLGGGGSGGSGHCPLCKEAHEDLTPMRILLDRAYIYIFIYMHIWEPRFKTKFARHQSKNSITTATQTGGHTTIRMCLLGTNRSGKISSITNNFAPGCREVPLGSYPNLPTIRSEHRCVPIADGPCRTSWELRLPP